jgi:hypothetical protein
MEVQMKDTQLVQALEEALDATAMAWTALFKRYGDDEDGTVVRDIARDIGEGHISLHHALRGVEWQLYGPEASGEDDSAPHELWTEQQWEEGRIRARVFAEFIAARLEDSPAAGYAAFRHDGITVVAAREPVAGRLEELVDDLGGELQVASPEASEGEAS